MTDTRNWRLGTHYQIHGYAECEGSFDDEPIFTASNPTVAQQIIEDHRGVLSVRRDNLQLSKKVAELVMDNFELKQQLAEANRLINEGNRLVTALRGNALRTVGTARRAYNVLGELLNDRDMSTPDASNGEAACE